MLLSEIQTKDVVNVTTGNKIGRIKDLDIDVENGNIISISVLTISKFRSFFKGDDLVVIPFTRIVKIGSECVIVNYNTENS